MSHRPQTVVVTGASAGVGRAIVRAYGRRRARIGLLARGLDGLEGARRDVELAGGEALVLPTDVADPDAVEAAAQAVEDKFGPIDVWINNAMVSVFAEFMDMTAAEFKRVTEVTYLGYVYGTMSALRRMQPRDHGTIIQVGSALAYRGIPLQSAYCGAKHAIQGFNESVRCELMHRGSNVHLSMVHLPAVNTPQFRWVKSRLPRKSQPVPPIYQPELVADAIVWAADHKRRELYVGAPTAISIIGNKVAPALGDWYLSKTGYESQMIDEPADKDPPDNLWQPVPGDHGAHGVFGDRATDTSWQLTFTKHRKWFGLAAAGVAGLACAALSSSRTNNGHHCS